MIEKTLRLPEFVKRPPVLVDVGASGALHELWKPIAKKSVCLCFDADERDFGFVEKDSPHFRRLIVYRAAAVDGKNATEAEFYLTRYPHCSSTLPPDGPALADWSFAGYFDVERKIRVRAVSLSAALKDVGLDYVDGFKTDSQGVDLRLFMSLDPEIRRRVLWAALEPGLIDAYVGEDKLPDVFRTLASEGFWLSSMKIQGSTRITEGATRSGWEARAWSRGKIRLSPGWGELAYLNSFRDRASFGKREYLLGWIFAVLEGQFGFALELAQQGKESFRDPYFDELVSDTLRRMRWDIVRGIPRFLARAVLRGRRWIMSRSPITALRSRA